jgi:hypothetical protein
VSLPPALFALASTITWWLDDVDTFLLLCCRFVPRNGWELRYVHTRVRRLRAYP